MAGTYGTSSYFLARCTSEVLCQVWIPLVYLLVAYWPVGFEREAGKFFIFLFALELCFFSANSIALVSSAATRSFVFSAVILAFSMETARIFSGFFLAPAFMPSYWVWLHAVSYLKYPYFAITQSHFTGIPLACPSSNATCTYPTGDAYLAYLGIDLAIWACFLCSFALILVLRFSTYLMLRKFY
jgi:hypothetical protein